MENLEDQSHAQVQPRPLEEQMESLRQLVAALLLVLLLVSGTLTIFLNRQWRFSKNEIDLLTPQATQMLTDFNRNLPMMQDLLRKLDEYSKTHPDFAPIAARYHLSEVLGKTPGAPTNGLPFPSGSKP